MISAMPNFPIDQINIFRWIFLGLCAFLFSISAMIIYSYARWFGKARHRALVTHIVAVGISYMLFIGSTTIDTVKRFEREMDIRLPMRLAAAILGFMGLWSLIIHLRYERRAHRNINDPATICPNCGSIATDNYCARCGAQQKQPEKR